MLHFHNLYQINATLVSIRDVFQKYFKFLPIPTLVNGSVKA